MRKNGFQKTLQYIKREKIIDAECDEKYVRNQIIRSKVVYQKHVRKGSLIDDIFNRIMRHEVEYVCHICTTNGSLNPSYKTILET